MKVLYKARDAVRAVLCVVSESKKAKALVVGLSLAIAKKLGLDVSESEFLGILGVLSAYMIGQGIADNGKEAAKLESGGE